MKKGFTLVELIAVVAILAITLAFSMSVITGVRERAKNKLYEEQIKRIEAVSEEWAVLNANLMPEVSETYRLTLTKLVEADFLKSEEIKNPRDNNNLIGCVHITNSNNKYHYTYTEPCN